MTHGHFPGRLYVACRKAAGQGGGQGDRSAAWVKTSGVPAALWVM